MRTRNLLKLRRPGRPMLPAVQSLERRVLLSAGELDPTFGGGDGKVLTSTPFPVGQVEALPAGGFVTPASDAGGPIGFMRFRPDGSLDTSLGAGDGIVATSFPSSVRDIQLRGAVPVPHNQVGPDGRVLAHGIGTTGTGSAARRVVVLARFNADGSLDRTFGPGGADGDGRVTFVPPVPSLLPWLGVEVMPDQDGTDAGVIVIGPTTDPDRDHAFFLAALKGDGSTDAAFGANGWEWFARLGLDDHVQDLVIGQSGDFFVVGDTTNDTGDSGAHRDLFAWRFFLNGGIDWVTTTDVRSAGPASGAGDSSDYATAATVTTNGFLVVAAQVTGWNADTAVVAYSGTGQAAAPVPWTGPDAPTRIDALGSGFGEVVAAAGGPDGFHVSRFFLWGPRDPAYQPPNAVDFATFGGGNATPTAVVPAPGGRIDVAGPVTFAEAPTRPKFGLARFQGSSGRDAIEQRGDTLFVRGTEGADTFRLEMGPLVQGSRDLSVSYTGATGDTVVRHFDVLNFEPFDIDVDSLGGDDRILVGKSVIAAAILRGGAGDDLILGGSGRDEFFGGDGNDTVSYEDRDNDLFISLDDVANDGGRRDENVHSDVENVIGGSGNDNIVGSSDANRLEGRGGNDTISGLGGNDLLLGGPGDDVLSDTSGANALGGAGGRDTFNGSREPADAPQDYPAEAAALQGPVVRAENRGYEGTGYADFTNASGDTLTFVVDAAREGAYRLTFRYANGSASDRPLDVRVNDRSGKRVSFAPTGGWDRWKTVTVELPLETDPANQVVLRSIGSNGPNVDTLYVSPGPGRPPEGPQTLQAEDGRVEGAIVSRAASGYTGTGFVDFVNRTGDSVEWTVNVPESGRYRLDFRYANGSSAGRAMSVSVNDRVVEGSVPFAPTGSWSTWSTSSVVALLDAGLNQVRLVATGQSGPNVDALAVALATEPPPGPQTLQAEDGARSGAVVSRSHTGYTGTGYVDFVNASGDFIEWTVNVPASGIYSVELRYANGSTSLRPLNVIVNGDFRAGMTFPSTGSWSSWSTSRPVATQLVAGANKIRVMDAGSSGPNVDSITVRPASGRTLQAEDAQLSGPVVSSVAPGYTGTGYVIARPGQISFTVDTPQTRDYMLEFRYQNTESVERSLRLLVDGVLQYNLGFRSTMQEQAWRIFATGVPLRLAAGTHRITLENAGVGAVYVDALTVI